MSKFFVIGSIGSLVDSRIGVATVIRKTLSCSCLEWNPVLRSYILLPSLCTDGAGLVFCVSVLAVFYKHSYFHISLHYYRLITTAQQTISHTDENIPIINAIKLMNGYVQYCFNWCEIKQLQMLTPLFKWKVHCVATVHSYSEWLS
jgi:hypothetical protein